MIDLLLQFAVSNAAAAGLIALVAWAVHRRGRRPAVAHALWLMVLIALVTPPLVRVPLIPVPTVAAETASTDAATPDVGLTPSSPPPARVSVMAMAGAGAEASAGSALPTESPVLSRVALDRDLPAAVAPVPPVTSAPRTWLTTLLVAWLAGSAIVLGWSLTCVIRFERRLRRACRPAPASVHRLVTAISAQFGLRRVPRIRTVDATVSPMAWWAGGRATIILPTVLAESLDRDALRWILAHEVAHIRRRDHLVRWVEWLVCVAFWWNPLSWWARRNLRINEELCCDALVLETLGAAGSDPAPARRYAQALMHVVEFLAAPALRPPALASAVNGGGVLETRFRMIMSKNAPSRSPRWLTAAAVAASAALMPLGFAYAVDADVEAVTKRLKAAVEAGELEAQQARMMLQTLRQSEVESTSRDIQEAVDAGWLSREEAVRKLQAVERAAAKGRTDGDRMQDEFARASEEMKRLVEAGRISEADMNTRLVEMKRAMERAAAEDAVRRRVDRRNPEADRQREELARAEAQLKRLFGAGRVSEADMNARMRGMQAELERAAAESQRRERRDPAAGGQRDVIASLEADLRRMVEAGLMTEDGMRRHLESIRGSMRDQDQRRAQDRDRATDRRSDRDQDSQSNRSSSRDSDRSENRSSDRDQNSQSNRSSSRDTDRSENRSSDRAQDRRADRSQGRGAQIDQAAAESRRRIEALQKVLRAEVDAGKLTREQAQQKLDAAVRDTQLATQRRRFDAARKELQAALVAGKFTQEDAQRRLDELSRAMQEEAKKRGEDATMLQRRARLTERQRDLQRAYDAGRITKEEAQRRLDEAARSFGGDEEAEDEFSGTPGERLQQAVVVIERYEADLNKLLAAGTITKAEFDLRLVRYSNEVLSRSGAMKGRGGPGE